MKKKIAISIILCVILFITTWSSYLASCKTMTGITYFASQNISLTKLSTLTGSLDDVTSLYLTGAINVDDYGKHLKILEQEFLILCIERQKEIEKYPVQTGTHSFLTKYGTELIQEMYVSVGDMITDMNLYKADKDQLGYAYLAHKQKIANATNTYKVIYYMLINTN